MNKENQSFRNYARRKPIAKNYAYTIHWQRETAVTEWDVMRLAAQVELCGEDCHAVMHKVNSYMIGETGGLYRANGVFNKVYRRLQDANESGLQECLRIQIRQARRGIRQVLGTDMESYTDLLNSDEIHENIEEEEEEEEDEVHCDNDDEEDDTSCDPKKNKTAVQRKIAGCEILWGMNSTYDSQMAHGDLHFCTEILTDITCWIERRTLH